MRNIDRFILSILIVLLLLPSSVFAKERVGRVTYQITVAASDDAKNVNLWFPFPASDENQDISGVSIKTNASNYVLYADNTYGSKILHANWAGANNSRGLTASFTVKRREVVKSNKINTKEYLSDIELKRYLDLSFLGITEKKVKNLAGEITKGKKENREKALAVYDWIVENMYRDSSIKGCGLGDVEKLLVQLGGKCVDIHTVYVALARAAGVPAREIYGIRIPKGKTGDITKSQHCWVEVFLPKKGWFVVDPADVRKIMLEQKLSLEQVKSWRDYFFGNVDENRIAFGTGKNIILNPPQVSGPLTYFGYPYAEEDGKPLNEDIYGFNLGYKITFEEIEETK